MDLEAEYNNRRKVPSHPAIIAGWARDAAAFRAAHANAELDIAYGPTPRQKLDLFWPTDPRSSDPLPRMAIFLHGGYWQGLDKSFSSHLAKGLLAHGVAVAIPSYELCPTVELAEIVEQVRTAAGFLHRSYGGRQLAIGHSAGGHLAAMLLATDWVSRGLPDRMVAAALPISGLFDLAPLINTTINDALRLDLVEARRLSPLYLPPPVGRVHAFVGGAEGYEYTRQSRSIAAAWSGKWDVVEGADHFTILAGLLDPRSPMVQGAIDLIA